jgi:class 3 adenylate cyclase
MRIRVKDMYRQFRELLDAAIGTSEYVVVANVDVRGFSAFSTRVDSADTGLYIKKIYARLIDDYFGVASFFKPTGDGLLLTIPYSEETLRAVIVDVIGTSFRLLDDFESLLDGDPMITFETPPAIGIGLSRGSASCLRSGETVLDYSGRVLNLASRLMGLARPSGVVCDGAFGVELLPDDLASSFMSEEVYLPGIAETTPISIRYSWEYTEISLAAKRPLKDYVWKTQTFTNTLNELEEGAPRHRVYLEERPADESQIAVDARYPQVTASGRKRADVVSIRAAAFDYALDASRPYVSVHTTALASALRSLGVKGPWEVYVSINYPTFGT